MLKASCFMQLDLESGAWVPFFKKSLFRGTINRGGGAGKSGHRSTLRAGPTPEDMPEKSRLSLWGVKAAVWVQAGPRATPTWQ